MSAPCKTKAPSGPRRRDMLAKVHIAKKDLGLDDDAYRDLLERVTGKRSAGELGEAELDAVLRTCRDELGWTHRRRRQPRRAGRRPVAPGPLQAKARALWLTLYHLGEVESPEEASLDRFVRRQTGLESLRFLPPEKAHAVIEALKAWGERAGVTWPTSGDGAAAKAAVITAQWRRLMHLGAVHPWEAGLETWLRRRYGVAHEGFLSEPQADHAIEQLGAWVRRAMTRRDAGGANNASEGS